VALYHYFNSVQDDKGDAIAGASIAITTEFGIPINVYADETGTIVLGSVVTTDSFGRFDFYIVAGKFNFHVSGSGLIPYTMFGVRIIDPVAGGPGNTNLSATRTASAVNINSDTGSDAIISVADSSTAGVMSATLFNKLAGIPVGGATNLNAARTPTSVTINSDTGNDAIIPVADGSNAGVMSSADKTKLDGITGVTNLSATRTASTVTIASSSGLPATLITADATNAGIMTASDKVKLDGIPPGGGGVSPTLCVLDYGADPTGLTDSYADFMATLAALPLTGGKIIVPSGTYLLNSEPTWSTSVSIHWDIDPAVVFTGAGTGIGKFPYMATNPAQMAVGPYIQSQSSQPGGSAGNGGIAAFNVEMLQPNSFNGQSVAIYAGANGSSNQPNANVWAINALIRAETGSTGVYQGIEIDVDVFSAASTTVGLSISGGGSNDADLGISLNRIAGLWSTGMNIERYGNIGTWYNPFNSQCRAIVVSDPTAFAGAAFSARQNVNNSETVLLQRRTDSAPTGYLLRCINAANTVSLAHIDVDGNMAAKAVTFDRIVLVGTGVALSSGQVGFCAEQSISATTGANGAPPAQVALYLDVWVGGTKFKMPLYNA